jgi:hypothetical protein
LPINPFAPDTIDAVPLIPLWLARRPVVAGLAVPWITARGLDGRYLFGALDPLRQQQAILDHRCQVCGRPLEHRSILLMRLDDLPRKRTSEPALDPVCAAYTAAACPMIAGQMRRYRSTPPALGHGVTAQVSHPARFGAPAEPWFAVWLDRYSAVTDDGQPFASYTGTRPLRIRPITWRQMLPW